MPRRQPINRLRLGPIVGHTDDTSTKVWIQVRDDPAEYKLRIVGAGLFPFERTEKNGALEFRTGIARAAGLRPDWEYRYSVTRRGRRVPGSNGSFRTMPEAGTMAPIVFLAVSCSTLDTDGIWEQMGKFMRDAKPAFLLMMGDQVYVDSDQPQVFKFPTEMTQSQRRAAIVEKYRLSWGRPVVQRVFANIPTYMAWDDHDNRDGWGSLASDSPTMVAKYPRGEKVFADVVGHFEDCRDVYWHFQACHNPMPDDANISFPNYISDPPLPGLRQGMPFAFRCGRVAVLMLESRGERDVFRKEFPILGARQWQFIEEVLANLAPDIDVLAVATPTPIASMDPNGTVQKLMGERTDDIEAFRRGDEKGVLSPYSTEKLTDLALAIASVKVSRVTGANPNLGAFKVSNIDEARDQWAHRFARPEQIDLLNKANRARFINRPPDSPRELLFLGGDIHVGCVHDLTFSDPPYEAQLLTSSAISAIPNTSLVVGSYIDEDFAVAKGIHSKLRHVVTDYNFGVVEIVPSPDGAKINALVAHQGNSFAAGVDISKLI